MDDDLGVLLKALPQEHPDPDGDVQLHIQGAEASLSLRASSSTLSAASPYFKEDDPYAMALICSAIHFVDLGDIRVSSTTLEHITLAADKYRLVACLAGWARIWLRQQYLSENHQSLEVSSPGRCWILLRIAYFFGDHDALSVLSFMIIYQHPSYAEKSLSDSHLTNTIAAELPFLVESTIDTVRQDILHRIYNALEAVISNISNRRSCRDHRPNACRRDALVARFTQELNHHLSAIWPRPLGLQRDVDTVLNALLNFDDAETYLESNYHSKGLEVPLMYSEESDCDCGPMDFKEAALEIWEDEKAHMKGLCLACINATVANGRPLPGFEHSNCRAANLRSHQGSRDSHEYNM